MWNKADPPEMNQEKDSRVSLTENHANLHQ